MSLKTIKAAANMGFASGGATYVLETFCFSKKLVPLDSFVLLNPLERKALSVGLNAGKLLLTG